VPPCKKRAGREPYRMHQAASILDRTAIHRYTSARMLQVGIVGLPNVGKSTLFKTLTKKEIACENFPFCTIEPNVGIVEVPDFRLQLLAEISKSEKIIPTAIEFVDIAGLVKGAHKGEGLGNKFLSNIREVDMVVHVIRSFADENVHHVDGSIDAARDVEIIEMELAMADMETVQKRLSHTQSKMKAGREKDLEREESGLQKILAKLEEGKMASEAELNEEETRVLKHLQLLSRKPILYVVNIGEEQVGQEWVSPLGSDRLAIPLCVKLESEIVEMPEEEQEEFLKEMGLAQSGLDYLITKCYELLDLITYLTTGPLETRAWTVARGAKGPQAAGVIHTDFEKGFIRAEVIHWKDLVDAGSELAAKEAGKMRIEGKEYVVEDGDVCHFRVGV
jgi:GTP-binding protein YchF